METATMKATDKDANYCQINPRDSRSLEKSIWIIYCPEQATLNLVA